MGRFWKWLAARSFMQDTTPPKSAEEEIALAVLRIVDEYKLVAGVAFTGACIGHKQDTGVKIPAVHFMIEVCDQPEVCFGPTFTQGITVQ